MEDMFNTEREKVFREKMITLSAEIEKLDKEFTELAKNSVSVLKRTELDDLQKHHKQMDETHDKLVKLQNEKRKAMSSFVVNFGLRHFSAVMYNIGLYDSLSYEDKSELAFQGCLFEAVHYRNRF